MKNLLLSVLFVSVANLSNSQNLLWSQVAHPDGLQVNGVAFSADGSKVLSGTNCHPAKIRLYDAGNGTITWDYTVDMSLECMMGVGFSADGQYLATAEETGHLMLFDYSQAIPDSITTISLGTTYAFSLAFAPNSNKLAIGASNGKLQTYTLSTGAIDLNIIAHPGWVTAVAYSPDNSRIITGGSDDKIKIWDTLGNVIDTLISHAGDITAVRYTPDGSKIVSAAKDNKIKIWDAASGTLLYTITVSNQDVNAIDISPNGNYIVSASSDTTIRVWSLTDYSLQSTYSMPNSGFYYCVAWSPDGTKIACGTDIGLAIVYDATTVGVNENNPDFSVNLFPNPCSELLNIQFAEGNIASLKILDVNGKTILEKQQLNTVSRTEIDLSEFAAGVYFVQLTGTDGSVVKRKIIR